MLTGFASLVQSKALEPSLHLPSRCNRNFLVTRSSLCHHVNAASIQIGIAAIGATASVVCSSRRACRRSISIVSSKAANSDAAAGVWGHKSKTPQVSPIAMADHYNAEAASDVKSLLSLLPNRTEFNWHKQWYPVHTIDAMDHTQTYRVQLLGMKLVIFNDGPSVKGQKKQGEWKVSKDTCPHTENDLHGSFPTKVINELLFVFPFTGPDTHSEAAKVKVPITEELRDPAQKSKWKISSQVRDFPCSWDNACENLMDPAHFCAAHHNTLGSRYKSPAPFQYGRRQKLGTDGGFRFEGDAGMIEFYPPCLVNYFPSTSGMPLNGKAFISTYAVPTAPGRVRFIATVLRDESPMDQTLATIVLSIFNSAPTWFQHVMSPIVLHQDSGILYSQSRNLREKGYRPRHNGSTDIKQLYYCPSPVDRGIMSFHAWLRLRGGGGPNWACEDTLHPRGTEDIFDIWDAHTTNCQHCMKAYRNLEMLKYLSAAIFCAAFFFLPFGGERTTIAVLSLVLAVGLHAFNSLFTRYETSHSAQNIFNPLGVQF